MPPSQRFFVPSLILLTVVFAGASAFYYHEAKAVKQDPKITAQEESRKLVERVGALIVLPEDEDPTIATVTDPVRLAKTQPFFANAKIGDKVLIYTNAKKAILYSPTENKIVEVAPITIGSQQQTAVTTSTKAP